LPRDIQISVIELLDNKSKRFFRLASKELFNVVRYNDFNIYFARSSTWPAIADRLGKYQWPIQLKFKKIGFDLTAENIIEHLYKIKSLISVDVDWGDKIIQSFDETNPKNLERWMQLSTLTNLQRFNMKDTTHILLPNYMNLTTLSYTGALSPNKFLDRATNLHELTFTSLLNDPHILLPIDALAKLTRLDVTLERNFGELDLRNLKKLEKLRISDSYASILDIEGMTSLEALEVNIRVLRGDLGRMPKLTELAHAQGPFILVYFPPLSLANLRALQSYSLLSYSTTIAELNPDSITKLCTTSETTIDYVARLTNLMELYIKGGNTVDMEQLVGLTKLTRLTLAKHKGDLTKLVNLKEFEMTGNYETNYYLPTTLEALRIYDLSPKSFSLFPQIPNLTSLSINLQFLTDYYIDSEDVWNIMIKLTNLRDLDLSVGDDDEHWSRLENLTNLTRLNFQGRVTTQSFISSTTKLTNMQSLRLFSYNAQTANIDVSANYGHFPYLYSHNFAPNQLN
jgi:hypothetical protein